MNVDQNNKSEIKPGIIYCINVLFVSNNVIIIIY